MIDEVEYREQKAKLLLQKKSLQAEITNLARQQNDWLAPFQDWVKDAVDLDKIALADDLFRKKVVAKEIFGSHLRLGGRALSVATGDPAEYQALATPTQWAVLRAAHSSSSVEPLGSVLVPRRGLEPPQIALLDPKSSASTNFATWAYEIVPESISENS